MVLQNYGSSEICTKQQQQFIIIPCLSTIPLDVRVDSNYLLKHSHAQKVQFIKPFVHI